jgi:hypothetical protein
VCLQEVEKEVWEKDALGKRKLKLVQETEYCYEADMEGACRLHCSDWLLLCHSHKHFWVTCRECCMTMKNSMGCLGPDCAGVYKASLLKAFRRTVEEGRSAFVIVDAPNLRVKDFKPYWDAGQVWTSPASSFYQLPCI